MLRVIVAVCGVLVAASILSVPILAGVMPIRNCPNVETTGKLVHVIVPDCDRPPCLLIKGKTYAVEVDFVSHSDTNNLTVKVTGNDIIGGVELPWNGVKPDGCADMYIGRCPLYNDDYVTYGVNLTVLEMYPNVDLTIKWLMRDDNDDVIWCFMLPAQIRPPSMI